MMRQLIIEHLMYFCFRINDFRFTWRRLLWSQRESLNDFITLVFQPIKRRHGSFTGSDGRWRHRQGSRCRRSHRRSHCRRYRWRSSCFRSRRQSQSQGRRRWLLNFSLTFWDKGIIVLTSFYQKLMILIFWWWLRFLWIKEVFSYIKVWNVFVVKESSPFVSFIRNDSITGATVQGQWKVSVMLLLC